MRAPARTRMTRRRSGLFRPCSGAVKWMGPRAALSGGTPSFQQTPSASQGPLELALRPLDHFIELLVALREFGDHDGVDRLIVHLGSDLRTRRRAEDGGLLVAARRVAVGRAEWRLDFLPGLEVVEALERRQVVNVRGPDPLRPTPARREEQQ